MKKFYLKDYKAPAFWQDKVDLTFRLFDKHTEVEAVSHLKFNSSSWTWPQALELSGENLELLKIEINGQPWSLFSKDEGKLIITDVPQEFSLKIVTKILPSENKSMEGLYESNGLYCSQCESQGFRKITYFTDRPDNMAIYSTRIEANKVKYPHLLSNGNLIDSGSLGDRHFAVWKDPFKKPSYLFALVAGDLDMIEDQFITKSGRAVTLRVFANRGRKDRCYHAMNSLKWSMKWDEERFNLEYDLDLFMIVAVDDFNFGAMENKGLNIYNSMAALANEKTADDQAFARITSIVGHEYFHNWSGNRVTCRDWFQISLKEGLTVYRDQEFTSDLFSRPVQRLDDVISLRERQFAEDASPNAHPVRPDSAFSIENFYTATIYEKGAELIRMIETIIGREKFTYGIAKYFELYDGQAVTTEEFIHAMELASKADLSHFRLWYTQAGTPVVDIQGQYDANNKKFKLIFTQSTPATPGQEIKLPLHIPVKVGLLSSDGQDLIPDTVLHLTKSEQIFEFENISEPPLPSLFRDFSAPVKYQYEYTEIEDLFLLEKDSNLFNRWEAAQRLYTKSILEIYFNLENKITPKSPKKFIEALRKNLIDADRDPLFVSRLVRLPSFSLLEQSLDEVNPINLAQARKIFKKFVATELDVTLVEIYERYKPKNKFEVTPRAVGQRALMGAAIAYLCCLEKPIYFEMAYELFIGKTMTEKSYALSALIRFNTPLTHKALADFYAEYGSDGVLINRWIAQVVIPPTDNLEKHLLDVMNDPQFNLKNPNNNNMLWRGLASEAPASFHQPDGAIYKLLADRIIEIDSFNPNVASRLVHFLENWKKYTKPHSLLMKAQLERVAAQPKLSPNTYELVTNALK